jgi:hypothetical protein
MLTGRLPHFAPIGLCLYFLRQGSDFRVSRRASTASRSNKHSLVSPPPPNGLRRLRVSLPGGFLWQPRVRGVRSLSRRTASVRYQECGLNRSTLCEPDVTYVFGMGQRPARSRPSTTARGSRRSGPYIWMLAVFQRTATESELWQVCRNPASQNLPMFTGW